MNRIKAARKAAGYTLKGLSDETACTIKPSRIANWESGTRQINVESAKVLGKILGVTPGYLMGIGESDSSVDASLDAMTQAQRDMYVLMVRISRLNDADAKAGLAILKAYLKSRLEQE